MGDHAHLFVDVVLPHVLGECRELAFQVLGMLTPQWRRPEFLSVWPMTGGAGWNAALRIAGKDQADRGIWLAQTAAALRFALTGYWRQPSRTMGEIGRHIGRVLIAQGGRDRAHSRPYTFARAEIIELFVDHGCIHAGKGGEQVG